MIDEAKLIDTVSEILKSTNGVEELSAKLTMDSGLGAPREWDSLSFVSVFLGVGEKFDVELDDEDAVHFRTMREIHALLTEIEEE